MYIFLNYYFCDFWFSPSLLWTSDFELRFFKSHCQPLNFGFFLWSWALKTRLEGSVFFAGGVLIKKTVAKRRFDAKIQNDNDRAWSFIFHHKDQYFSLYLQLGKLSNFRFEQDWAIENQFPPSVVMKLDVEGRCISTLSFEESNLKKRNYWFVKQTNVILAQNRHKL